MQKQKAQLQKLTLVGLTVRTNNKNEMNPETSKIGRLAADYWSNRVANNIQHRSKPGVTYAVYTDFESDEQGDYTYFIGEAVDSLEDQDLEKFKTITIPASNYQKFTTEPGKMPDVVISAWQAIWAMKESDFGGKRKYIADFEVYDERSADPNNTVIDIYIGIEG
ncbi:AraC family transcriptional regulator (plasmid) [Coxiella burnetii]|uniref:DNA-binding protein n=1 Tax=Coxiella burnetii (strain Dugway 5J108-111) TaxID=434922 RepID=A9KH49_COXBN|nr:GyrI-like domain-containing protein [Coxiella burnetii]ABS78529.1 DNA-binding protein [Coxiella burnetii Dugway 5J108-111]OYK79194.1 AraC family transcriptional regulator [Coxiella burnetii]OYK81233.1 AraC family transcriptional regulator [Coxiella burnetii]